MRVFIGESEMEFFFQYIEPDSSGLRRHYPVF